MGEVMLSHEVFTLACVWAVSVSVTDEYGGGGKMEGVYGLIVRRELIAYAEGDGDEPDDEDERAQNGDVEEDEEAQPPSQSLPPPPILR